jgi:hypothetical protein
MIDETIRPISHRQSVQQYEVYRQGRLAQIELEKKQEFEESLRNSVKTIPSNSGLYGASKNIFEQNLTKDSAKLISLNKRKHKMKEDMIELIGNLSEKEFDRFEATMMTYQLTK